MLLCRLACIAVLALTTGCSGWMYSVGKGKPPNPRPELHAPERAVITEWIHPLACGIEFEFDGEVMSDILLIIEPRDTEHIVDGKIQLPRWMWEHGASIGWPSRSPEVLYQDLHPVGSEIRIEYPLKGKKVLPEGATGQTTYNGYVGVPRTLE